MESMESLDAVVLGDMEEGVVTGLTAMVIIIQKRVGGQVSVEEMAVLRPNPSAMEGTDWMATLTFSFPLRKEHLSFTIVDTTCSGQPLL
jgi:hypothetical protein